MTALTRRAALGALAGASLAAAAPGLARAQAPDGAFKLEPLPYAFNALEPHIDARTMEIHHGRHHAAYVANLNAALKDHPQIAKRPLHQLLADLSEVPLPIRATVRNNAGGHANHSMFWQIMSAPASGAGPQGELAQAIDRDLGGMEKLQAAFNEAGTRLFGSGWVFITVARDGKLKIETRPNQDTPLLEGGRALMGNDVWEHAYYLHYQNRRPDYLKAWWNVVNWQKIGERYAAAKAGTLNI